MVKEHKADLSMESFLRYAERRYKHLRSAALRWHTIIKELQKEIKADGKNIELFTETKDAILLLRLRSSKLAPAAVKIIQEAGEISLVNLDLELREDGFTFNIKSLQQALKDWSRKNDDSLLLTGRGRSSVYHWDKKIKIKEKTMTNTPDTQFKYLLVWGRNFQQMDNYLFELTEEKALELYKTLRVKEAIEPLSTLTKVQLFKRVDADIDPAFETEIEEAIFNRKAELQKVKLQEELEQKSEQYQQCKEAEEKKEYERLKKKFSQGPDI
jgi:hypothetical protein